MAWYKTGTIAVDNGTSTVTGTGTAWIANLRVGGAIILPDERTYEITGISSDTTLAIAPDYLGTDVTGGAYRVEPTQSYNRDVAERVAALTANYGGVYDTVGQGKFPAGTESLPGLRFTADEDTGVRRVGTNAAALVAGGADVLDWSTAGAALTGLLTGTAVTQAKNDATAGRVLKVGDWGLNGAGTAPALTDLDAYDIPAGVYSVNGSTVAGTLPTGNTVADLVLVMHSASNQTTQIYSIPNDGNTWLRKSNASTSWGAWRKVFDGGNVVGALAESGGVQTGGLFEDVSSGGNYGIKFPDGTLLMWGVVATSASAGVAVTFPVATLSAAATSINYGMNTAATTELHPRHTGKSTSGMTVSAYDGSGARVVVSLEWSVMARWK